MESIIKAVTGDSLFSFTNISKYATNANFNNAIDRNQQSVGEFMSTSSSRSCLVSSTPALLALLITIAIAATIACSNNQSQSSTAHDANAVVTETNKNPLMDLQTAASAGKPLYAIHCSACHGDAGKADGIASASLPAKPTDLTAGETVSSPDGKLFLVIKNGKMKDGKFTMAPVKKLTDEQIWQVVAYVRTLSRQ